MWEIIFCHVKHIETSSTAGDLSAPQKLWWLLHQQYPTSVHRHSDDKLKLSLQRRDSVQEEKKRSRGEEERQEDQVSGKKEVNERRGQEDGRGRRKEGRWEGWGDQRRGGRRWKADEEELRGEEEKRSRGRRRDIRKDRRRRRGMSVRQLQQLPVNHQSGEQHTACGSGWQDKGNQFHLGNKPVMISKCGQLWTGHTKEQAKNVWEQH